MTAKNSRWDRVGEQQELPASGSQCKKYYENMRTRGPLGQTPYMFHNARTMESVTKSIITLVMLIGFSKFQLYREGLDFSYRIKQIFKKIGRVLGTLHGKEIGHRQ